jgi:hypothetical protein
VVVACVSYSRRVVVVVVARVGLGVGVCVVVGSLRYSRWQCRGEFYFGEPPTLQFVALVGVVGRCVQCACVAGGGVRGGGVLGSWRSWWPCGGGAGAISFVGGGIRVARGVARGGGGGGVVHYLGGGGVGGGMCLLLLYLLWPRSHQRKHVLTPNAHHRRVVSSFLIVVVVVVARTRLVCSRRWRGCARCWWLCARSSYASGGQFGGVVGGARYLLHLSRLRSHQRMSRVIFVVVALSVVGPVGAGGGGHFRGIAGGGAWSLLFFPLWLRSQSAEPCVSLGFCPGLAHSLVGAVGARRVCVR